MKIKRHKALTYVDALLRIETNKSSKVIITGGTFENPKAKKVFELNNSDEMIDAIKVLKELW